MQRLRRAFYKDHCYHILRRSPGIIIREREYNCCHRETIVWIMRRRVTETWLMMTRNALTSEACHYILYDGL